MHASGGAASHWQRPAAVLVTGNHTQVLSRQAASSRLKLIKGLLLPRIVALLTSHLETGARDGSASEEQLCVRHVWSPQWEKPSARSCNNHVKCQLPVPKTVHSFPLSFPWGKLPLSHSLGSLLILQLHTSSTTSFSTYVGSSTSLHSLWF